jgi:hypothetical protein
MLRMFIDRLVADPDLFSEMSVYITHPYQLAYIISMFDNHLWLLKTDRLDICITSGSSLFMPIMSIGEPI